MARKKQEQHAHSESWLVSYCDMISLLVTFFLMMMTFSTKDEFDVKEVGIGLLKGRGGIWKNSMSFPHETGIDSSMVDALARDLASISEGQAGEQKTSIQPLLDGITISFDVRSSFAPGSAEVNDELRKNVLMLAAALQRYTHLMVVEGYTDDRFQPTPEHPNAEAMGIARAQAVARVMLDNTLLRPDLVQISSAGKLRPRATNDLPAGRASNRRVEVRIVALAKPPFGWVDDMPQGAK